MAVPQEIWTFPKGLLSSSTQEPRVKSHKQGALLALCLQETDLCLDSASFQTAASTLELGVCELLSVSL